MYVCTLGEFISGRCSHIAAQMDEVRYIMEITQVYEQMSDYSGGSRIFLRGFCKCYYWSRGRGRASLVPPWIRQWNRLENTLDKSQMSSIVNGRELLLAGLRDLSTWESQLRVLSTICKLQLVTGVNGVSHRHCCSRVNSLIAVGNVNCHKHVSWSQIAGTCN